MMMKNGRTPAAALALVAGLAAVAAAAGAAAGTDAEFAGAASAAAATAAQGARAQKALAQSTANGGESVIRDQTTTVSVDLNAQTVKCSVADYSAPMLKVLIPDLAELTVLNHRNTREGAPCVAAGKCGDTVGPQNLLSDGAGTDRIPVRVVLKKVSTLDGDVCHVSLVETVTTEIRGVAFFHERAQDVADRAPADCR
jgi:hypothetical protein